MSIRPFLVWPADRGQQKQAIGVTRQVIANGLERTEKSRLPQMLAEVLLNGFGQFRIVGNESDAATRHVPYFLAVTIRLLSQGPRGWSRSICL